MTGNTNLNFSVDELTSLNAAVADARYSIQNNYMKVKECFEDLKTNVTGAQVNGLLVTITENLASIDSKMNVSFDQLTEFLNSQMKNYTTTYEGALNRLKAAFDYINTNM